MALFEKITEILRDIRNDTDHIARDLEDQYTQLDIRERRPDRYGNRFDRESKASSNAVWVLIFPNIFGFFFGLAVCRFVVLHGWFYLLFGVLGAFGIGTLKNIEFDGLSLVPALIRNGIIVGGLAIICAVFFALSFMSD